MENVSDLGLEVLHLILASSRPWVDVGACLPWHDAEELVQLERQGWIASWDVTGEGFRWPNDDSGAPLSPFLRPGRYITLTPWGAARLGVMLDEHWEFGMTLQLRFDGEGFPPKIERVRGGVEVPGWEASKAVLDKERRHVPIRIPTRSRMVELRLPDRIPIAAPRTPPDEPIIDPRTDLPYRLWGQPLSRRTRRRKRTKQGPSPSPRTPAPGSTS